MLADRQELLAATARRHKVAEFVCVFDYVALLASVVVVLSLKWRCFVASCHPHLVPVGSDSQLLSRGITRFCRLTSACLTDTGQFAPDAP